ncbi:GDSL esterase/lipase 7 isoform X2 [Oryza sativa Japonica Group]|uniref:GDSL esterase/lipase 7 isoform X2 n=1 Tax=Oryza sativa subsp. japonica TaxID=39947 RepID=UPI0007755874|nr:GDSL esterase/lipase 7 isoform X2 [Oryza sativa Japonica Group]
MALPFLLLLAFALLFPLSAPPRCCSAAPASSPPPSPPPSPAAAAAAPRRTPLVPALFVIGDSTADVGTNNYLGTLARADREPYGRDFDTRRPTGRFSNGRIPVDYIEKLGLPFVPPYLEQNMRMGVGSVDLSNIDGMIQGVNYASAAAGILSSSGSELGMHVSLSQQVQQVEDTYEQLSLALGEAATTDLFRKSVFFFSIGSNDFIHYYLRNVSGVQMRYLPWEFNQLLVNAMRQEIKNLYNINVRKVVMMGLPPVGCAPHFLWEYGSQDGECIDYINNVVIQFNYALRYMSSEFIRQHPGSMISYCDTFEGSVDILKNRDRYGFLTTTDACCGLGKYGGLFMCVLPQMACSDASSHVWWDEFHPTDAVNRILADNVWSGEHTKMCYPVDLQQMVKLK